jgi:protein-disulfide isomerase
MHSGDSWSSCLEATSTAELPEGQSCGMKGAGFARILQSVAGLLGVFFIVVGVAVAGESPRTISRADLVAALERGPGPTRGSVDAPVVVVEFSDFLCGYCRIFAQETLPKIEERYIREGKIRFVYRHMTVRGDASFLAAQAASCAEDQGKFWEFHDVLFGKNSPFVFTSARLKQYAARLRLDAKSFSACLDSGKYAERVETETVLGRALGATGTPAFLLNGQLVIGAYPFEAFQRGFDMLLGASSREPDGRAE